MTDTFRKAGTISETPEEREFELRAHIGSIWSGGRLFIGMYTFLLASLVFSYFYLRSSNNGQLWRPHHVSAPALYGTLIYGALLLAGVLAVYGQNRLQKGSLLDWYVAGWTVVILGVFAFIMQISEFSSLSFYPGSSGYASTFIGFAVINIATIGASTYWMETALARSHRMTRELGGSGVQFSSDPSARSFRANVSSMSYWWGFVALSSTLLFAMFYVM